MELLYYNEIIPQASAPIKELRAPEPVKNPNVEDEPCINSLRVGGKSLLQIDDRYERLKELTSWRVEATKRLKKWNKMPGKIHRYIGTETSPSGLIRKSWYRRTKNDDPMQARYLTISTVNIYGAEFTFYLFDRYKETSIDYNLFDFIEECDMLKNNNHPLKSDLRYYIQQIEDSDTDGDEGFIPDWDAQLRRKLKEANWQEDFRKQVKNEQLNIISGTFGGCFSTLAYNRIYEGLDNYRKSKPICYYSKKYEHVEWHTPNYFEQHPDLIITQQNPTRSGCCHTWKNGQWQQTSARFCMLARIPAYMSFPYYDPSILTILKEEGCSINYRECLFEESPFILGGRTIQGISNKCDHLHPYISRYTITNTAHKTRASTKISPTQQGTVSSSFTHTIRNINGITLFEGDISSDGSVKVKVQEGALPYHSVGYKIAISGTRHCVVKIGLFEQSLVAHERDKFSYEDKTYQGVKHAKFRTNLCVVLGIFDILEDRYCCTFSSCGDCTKTARSCFWTSELIYRVGDIICVDDFDFSMEKTCLAGIHFFYDPAVAIDYMARDRHYRTADLTMLRKETAFPSMKKKSSNILIKTVSHLFGIGGKKKVPGSDCTLRLKSVSNRPRKDEGPSNVTINQDEGEGPRRTNARPYKKQSRKGKEKMREVISEEEFDTARALTNVDMSLVEQYNLSTVKMKSIKYMLVEKSNEETFCPICYIDYDDKTTIKKFLPCGHMYCQKCIDEPGWINTHHRCPYCQQSFTTTR